jgi:hypothetical protein
MSCWFLQSFVSLLAMSVIGCVGGAQLVLKSPIEDRCTAAGLKGCEQIADGATLYADGNEPEGEQKLAQGLRANADKAAELRKFADALELVGKVPGAGQYAAPLQPAIHLVQRIAAEAAEREAELKASAPPSPGDAETQKQASVTANQVQPNGASNAAEQRQGVPSLANSLPLARSPTQASFWQFSGNNQLTRCRFPGTPMMLCTQEVTQARKIVTDVMVSTACSADVLIASRHRLNFDWLVYAPAGKGAEVHGASLPLEQKHSITVAIVPKNDEVALDIRCGVTTAWHLEPNEPAKEREVGGPPTAIGQASFSRDGI